MAGKAKKEKAPDTKKGIAKGQATGTAPEAKTDIAGCKQLYEVLQVRGVRGAQLNSIDECINYVAEYMNFCEMNPFITYEILKGGASASLTGRAVTCSLVGFIAYSASIAWVHLSSESVAWSA